MPAPDDPIDVREVARRAAARALSGAASAQPSPGARPRLRVAVASDHAGFALKEDVLAWLRELGHATVDLGTRDERPCDWPDFGAAVGQAVGECRCDLGVAIDALGIGVALAANKVKGARAALCLDEEMARSAREHAHANVLALGAKRSSRMQAHAVLLAFLSAVPGAGRHERRIGKLLALERRQAGPPARSGA